MPVHPDHINYLLSQWLNSRITAAELNELSELLMESKQDTEMENAFQSIISQLPAEGYPEYKEEDWEHLYQKIIQTAPARIIEIESNKAPIRQIFTLPRTVSAYRRIAVAASIILILGLGTYFIFFNKVRHSWLDPASVAKTDVSAPPTNRAMITLADGRQIFLDSSANGSLANQNNVQVVKLADGKIIYNGTASEVVYNTLTNPRGSKVIDMTLSDGSRVWLNAGSSVTYPIAFVGNERKVSITGEAYFEITASPNPSKGGALRPFIVEKGDMQVQVLGTHFNVNAYDDEDAIKVTLLEGSVKVTLRQAPGDGIIIKPGQQAVVKVSPNGGDLEGALTRNSVEVDAVVAWKNGRFQFNKASLQEVMRQIARWYDVDVSYEGVIPSRQFGGKMQRNLTLADMLDILTKSRVHYRIEGKKLIVTK
ncbi:MAG: FecR domain-containing protein [Chitinophagaceae bacterium]